MELVSQLRAHQRVRDGLTAAEWDEWSALPGNEARSDWLDARARGSLFSFLKIQSVSTAVDIGIGKCPILSTIMDSAPAVG